MESTDPLLPDPNAMGTVPMVKVTYPDPLFRPVPEFEIDVPHDWVLSEFPDSLFVMGPTAPPDGHWSNVVVRHVRVLPTATLQDIAKSTWAELKESYPDAEIQDQRLLHAQHLHYVREARFVIEESGELVTRFDTLTFGPVVDQPTVDLFHINWMHPTAAGDPRRDLYIHMLRSFRFTQ